MRMTGAGRLALWAFGRSAVSFTLSVLLAGGPATAEAAVGSSGNPGFVPGKRVPAATTIEGDARIVHALDRLTFGPRPGEVAAVRREGLNRWFEEQLEPATIDDAGLDARLADYPAMRLPVAELEAKYPGGNVIRQIMNGKIALPNDAQTRLLVEDEIELYKLAKAKREAAAAANAQRNVPMAGQLPVPAAPLASAMDAAQPGDPAKAAGGIAPVADPLAPDAAGKVEAARQVARLLALSPDARLEAALELPQATLLAMRNNFRGGQLQTLSAGMTPEQRETLRSLGGAGGMVSQELLETRVLRDVYSSRQLEAVMTDFWLNHFNVFLHKNEQEPYLLTAYERETIRPHALGRFEDLLDAVAESPAMLVYLDQAQSIGPNSPAATRNRASSPRAKGAAKGGLNENYGRELMELHTVGVNGGYTQADVTETAKVFTGWTVQRGDGQMDDTAGTFAFNDRRHEPGPKTVLGRTIPEGGIQQGLTVLHQLATSPRDGTLPLAEAGGALCERLSTGRAGGPDGGDLLGEERRYAGGAADDVYFAGVLGDVDRTCEGEDAGGVCDLRGAGERCGGERSGTPGRGDRPPGTAVVRDADAERVWLDGRGMGEHGRAGEPDELRAGAGGRTAERHECAVGGSGGRSRGLAAVASGNLAGFIEPRSCKCRCGRHGGKRTAARGGTAGGTCQRTYTRDDCGAGE